MNAGIANACTGQEGMGYCERRLTRQDLHLGSSPGSLSRIDRCDRHAGAYGCVCAGIGAMVPKLEDTRQAAAATAQSHHDDRYPQEGSGSDLYGGRKRP